MQDGDLDANGEWVSPEIAIQRAEKMNMGLKREANMRVKPEDTVVCVGDFACRGGEKGVMGLRQHPMDILSELNGKWVIVRGNHDENNGVKADCEFMTVEIGRYRVGVQHRPLMDVANPRSYDHMPMWLQKKSKAHAAYCREMFDFMICGHVHNAWSVLKISGLWHINVGVDVHRFMPIKDMEVMAIYERLIRNQE